jgi:uncharacterized phiE125 gp8 family phage protein
MALVMTSGPAVEPLSLAEAKAHLRIDSSVEDLLISSLITTSRLHIETALSLALVSQTWSYFIDALPPSATITLPLHPIQSVAAVRAYANDDAATILPLTSFQLDTHSKPTRIICRETITPPISLRRANGIEFSIIAGFGPTPNDVPGPIRRALLLLIAHWYENRDPVAATASGIPAEVSDLLAPWRSFRLA